MTIFLFISPFICDLIDKRPQVYEFLCDLKIVVAHRYIIRENAFCVSWDNHIFSFFSLIRRFMFSAASTRAVKASCTFSNIQFITIVIPLSSAGDAVLQSRILSFKICFWPPSSKMMSAVSLMSLNCRISINSKLSLFSQVTARAAARRAVSFTEFQ